jgi:hypothetical protein
MPISPKWSLPFRLPDRNLVYIFNPPLLCTYPAHIVLDMISFITVSGEEYKL